MEDTRIALTRLGPCKMNVRDTLHDVMMHNQSCRELLDALVVQYRLQYTWQG
jgi:hypothetical protein